MKTLETILNFLTSLVRIIFPRRQKPATGDCPCPHPYPRPVPDGDHPAVSPDGADGSDADSDRSDTLALGQGDWGKQPPANDWLGLSGYSLMLIGGAGTLFYLYFYPVSQYSRHQTGFFIGFVHIDIGNVATGHIFFVGQIT